LLIEGRDALQLERSALSIAGISAFLEERSAFYIVGRIKLLVERIILLVVESHYQLVYPNYSVLCF